MKINIDSNRKCFGTIDMFKGIKRAILEFEEGDKLVKIEFTKEQLEEFKIMIEKFKWKRNYHGGRC